jgi:hypothetical protein
MVRPSGGGQVAGGLKVKGAKVKGAPFDEDDIQMVWSKTRKMVGVYIWYIVQQLGLGRLSLWGPPTCRRDQATWPFLFDTMMKVVVHQWSRPFFLLRVLDCATWEIPAS